MRLLAQWRRGAHGRVLITLHATAARLQQENSSLLGLLEGERASALVHRLELAQLRAAHARHQVAFEYRARAEGDSGVRTVAKAATSEH